MQSGGGTLPEDFLACPVRTEVRNLPREQEIRCGLPPGSGAPAQHGQVPTSTHGMRFQFSGTGIGRRGLAVELIQQLVSSLSTCMPNRRAYKLGKRRWSYNQCSLELRNPVTGVKEEVVDCMQYGATALTEKEEVRCPAPAGQPAAPSRQCGGTQARD